MVLCRVEFVVGSKLDLGIWEQGLGELGKKKIERQIEAKSSVEEMELLAILTRREDIAKTKAMEKAEQMLTQGQAVVGLKGRGALHPFSRRWREPLDA